MKTLNEIKQEILRLNRDLEIKNKFEKNKPCAQFNFWIKVNEALLTQTEEIIKEIDEFNIDFKKYLLDMQERGILSVTEWRNAIDYFWLLLKKEKDELRQKIIGEEK